MAKNINTESYLSGTGSKLTVTNFFLYELSIYKIYKDRFECIDSKFYSTKKPLNIKKDIQIRKLKDYKIVIYIDWIGAPEEYIKNNNFKLSISKNKKKK